MISRDSFDAEVYPLLTPSPRVAAEVEGSTPKPRTR